MASSANGRVRRHPRATQKQSPGEQTSGSDPSGEGRPGEGSFVLENGAGEVLVSRELFTSIADDITVQKERTLHGVVNVNTAPVEVLACLPGLGEELAWNIVSHRQGRGEFTSIGELLDVPGITADVFKAVCSRLTVRPGTYRIVAEGRVPSTRARAATTITVMGDRTGFTWQEPPSNNPIDSFVNAKLKRTKTLPSPLCNDYEFVRRVFLDLTGLPPSAEQIRSFVDDKRDSRWKRDELIDNLVGSQEYVDHWANKWADLLQVNRKYLGAEGAAAFRKWIHEKVAANFPYEQFVRELLTATGSNKENPAASYFKILRTPHSAEKSEVNHRMRLYLGDGDFGFTDAAEKAGIATTPRSLPPGGE